MPTPSQIANPIVAETQRAVRDPYPAIWEVPDALWEKLFLPLLSELDPPSYRGRPRVNPRPCLNGMIYRARTGCQWNHLPTEFGSDSTVHRTVYRWGKKRKTLKARKPILLGAGWWSARFPGCRGGGGCSSAGTRSPKAIWQT